MGKKALQFGKRVLISLSIPFVLLLILFVFAGNSVSGSSVLLWLQLAIPPAILAWGVCFSLKVGMWDFSVGGVIFLAGIIGGNLAKAAGMEVWGVILLLRRDVARKMERGELPAQRESAEGDPRT